MSKEWPVYRRFLRYTGRPSGPGMAGNRRFNLPRAITVNYLVMSHHPKITGQLV